MGSSLVVVVEPGGECQRALVAGAVDGGVAHSRSMVWMKRSALPSVRGRRGPGAAMFEIQGSGRGGEVAGDVAGPLSVRISGR